jgi:hypothetical protein
VSRLKAGETLSIGPPNKGKFRFHAIHCSVTDLARLLSPPDFRHERPRIVPIRWQPVKTDYFPACPASHASIAIRRTSLAVV